MKFSNLFVPTGALFCTGLALISSSCSSRPLLDSIETAGVYQVDATVNGFSGGYPRLRDLDYLDYKELCILSKTPKPKGALGRKVERFFSSALIDNSAWYRGVRPHVASTSKLGPLLRVGTWNIEKSIRVAEVIDALKSEEAYKEMIDSEKAPEKSAVQQEMLRQRKRLFSADILFLQEMDVGVNRSGYINAAGELARALDMNYTYAPQSLEVDPVLLGLEPVKKYRTGEVDVEATGFFKAEPSRFKGAFGSAVLSRYPIKKVQVIPLKTIGYDWYEEEKKKTTFLEGARRIGAELAFENIVTREMKVGGRHFFRVDVEVPGCGPSNTLTLINVHLEIKCKPEVRALQMREILSYTANIPNPIIMAGDFNSSAIDVSPTSMPRAIYRTATDPSTLIPVAYEVFLDLDLASFAHRGINFLKNLHSPLATNIPIIFPNKVKPLFNEIENFRFADGTAFDFRGDKERSFGRYKGTLSNSNQKYLKGHVSTFQMKRPIGPLGLYRLDWIFVRSGLLDEPSNEEGSYQFAPHFGETLRSFNYFLKKPFSDHRPSMIDFPLSEPVSMQ